MMNEQFSSMLDRWENRLRKLENKVRPRSGEPSCQENSTAAGCPIFEKQQEIDALRSELAHNREQFSRQQEIVEKALVSWEERIAGIERNNHAAERILGEEKKKNAELQEQLRFMEAEFATREESTLQLNAAVDSLRTSLKAKEAETLHLFSELETLRQENDQLRETARRASLEHASRRIYHHHTQHIHQSENSSLKKVLEWLKEPVITAVNNDR